MEEFAKAVEKQESLVASNLETAHQVLEHQHQMAQQEDVKSRRALTMKRSRRRAKIHLLPN